jgi:hypothetical protein
MGRIDIKASVALLAEAAGGWSGDGDQPVCACFSEVRLRPAIMVGWQSRHLSRT